MRDITEINNRPREQETPMEAFLHKELYFLTIYLLRLN